MAEDEDLSPWTISVRAYSFRPGNEFPELDEVAILVAKETAKGFLNRTTVSRDTFHYGATFCLLIDPRVDSAEKQKNRILSELKDIPNGETDTISYEVINPSDCFSD